MADNRTKPATKEFTANDQGNYYSRITSIKVNGKNAYELKGKFLDNLHNNSFSGTNGEDAVEHIEYFLRIVDPIDLPNKMRSDDTELTNENGSDLEDECSSDVDETAKIFKIEDNLLDYETPLCKVFNEFKYLLKIYTGLFIFKIQEIKTYEEYELDNNMTGELEEPWSENGIPYQPCDHICEPYRFKNGMTKWPTGSSDIDGFCNGGELPGMIRVGSNNAGDTQDTKKERHDPSICTIRRFEMIKYSFRDDEEYLAIKENEYDDLTNTSKEAIHAYQEIFCMMDEGWMVTHTE
ncbi:hypothetical protein Tco_0345164 [Tanacetum coccineum]